MLDHRGVLLLGDGMPPVAERLHFLCILCMELVVEESVHAGRALGGDVDAERVSSGEASLAAVAHLSTIIEMVSLSLDRDVASSRVGSTGGAGSYDNDRARRCVVRVVANTGLDVQEVETRCVPVLV